MTNISVISVALGGLAGFLVTVVAAVAVCRRLLAAKDESCTRLLEEKDKACTKLLAEKDAMLTRNFAETIKTLREQFSVLAAQTLKSQSADLTELNKSHLEAVLKPLREQMGRLQDATK